MSARHTLPDSSLAEAFGGVAAAYPDRIAVSTAEDELTHAELTALRRVYADVSGPVALGTVKTNLGDLDSASGIAGMIKAVLAVRHGQIPASLLREYARRLRDHLARERPELVDVRYTLETGRVRLPERAAVRCGDLAGARQGLARLAAGGPGDPLDGAVPDLPPGLRILLPSYPFQRERYWIGWS